MTVEQTAVLMLLAGLLVVFALDRFRIDTVALSGLAIGALLGLVPADRLFSGFANPAVITVIEILMIVRVLSRARLVERLADRVLARLRTTGQARAGLAGLAAVLSMFMNNIGAFALMLPVVSTIGRRARLPLRAALIPVSYATLLGGLCTVIGTPPNLLASEALGNAGGRGFGFFDFAPVGLVTAAVGLVVILLWAPRVLDRADPGDTPDAHAIVAEVVIPPGSPLAGRTVGDAPGGLVIIGVIRRGEALSPLWPLTKLGPGDRLLVQADRAALEDLLGAGDLHLPPGDAATGSERIEATVGPSSTLVGSPVGALEFLHGCGARLIAVGLGRRSRPIAGRLADLRLEIGDVLHLEGPPASLRPALAERDAPILAAGTRPAAPLWPLAAFAIGVVAAGLGLAEPAIAFGAVVLALAIGGALQIRAALAAIDWSVIVMLSAIIPLGEAVATTGAAASFAAGIAAFLPVHMPAIGVGAVLLSALALTPLVNNAAVVVVLAPVAVETARAAAAPPEAFLIALAAGASLDFLTPFGHHNNTLAFGLGGYRFSDFPRTGWPVTLATAATAWIATVAFWL